eukprot:TRINITY_DN3203_c0_g1_i3.p1 TRINITY_DN3203_c0_g1~~TRINITY_DN3203_c0_g1_i3.p1  ORF type:complete len:360 (-),score=64.05 TRINITY_DN3203_c0_g1_i3:89-1168(-)
MNPLLPFITLLVILPFAYCQVQPTLLLNTPRDTSGPFDMNIQANFSGAGLSEPPSCTLAANYPFSATPGSTWPAGCANLATQTSRWTCKFTKFNLTSNVNNFNLLTGQIVPSSQCAGTVFRFDFGCDFALDNKTASVTSLASTSELEVTLTTDAEIGNATIGNDTFVDVPVFDKLHNKTTLIATATVKNIGSCAITSGVICYLDIPDRVPPNEPTVGYVLFDADSSNQGSIGCSLVGNTVKCPFNQIAKGASKTLKIGVTLVNNGILEYVWNCTDTPNLVDPSLAVANATVYGINVIPPVSSESSFSSESESSSVIINVVIPLSVFGGTMLLIFCVIGLSIGIYLLVKKVIFAEESVGF